MASNSSGSGAAGGEPAHDAYMQSSANAVGPGQVPAYEIEQWARQRTAAPAAAHRPQPGSAAISSTARKSRRMEQQHDSSASIQDSAASDDTAGPAFQPAAAAASTGADEQASTGSSRRQTSRQQRQAAADLRQRRLQRHELQQPQQAAQSGDALLHALHGGGHRDAGGHEPGQQCQHLTLPQSPLHISEQQQQQQQQQSRSLTDQLQQAQQQYRQRQQQLQEGLHQQRQQQQPGRRKRSALHPGAPEFQPAVPLQTQPALGAALEADVDVAEADACVICCEPAEAVAVGGCVHPDAPICGRCCLRQRLCYQVNKCPLCNAAQDEVAIGRWRPGGMPSFAEYDEQRQSLWQQLKWARGVLVDDHEPAPQLRRLTLHADLQRMTGRACPACDAEGAGAKPFPSIKELRTHVERVHQKRLCVVCAHARRNFTLELPLYSPTEMAEHQAGHPHCNFCTTHFYSSDELFTHMRARHFGCEVCQRATGDFNYFPDANSLIEHLRQSHHLCEEAECEGAFMAYGTPMELAQHRRDRHSRVMPRWQREQARRVDIDFDVRRRPGSVSGPGQGRQQQGFALIDDDVGLAAEEAFPDLPLNRQPAQAAGPSQWEVQRRAAAAAQAEEQFPSLGGRDAGGATPPLAQQLSAQHGGAAASGSGGPPARSRVESQEHALAREFFPDEFEDDVNGKSESAQLPPQPQPQPQPAAAPPRSSAPSARRPGTVSQPKPLVRVTVKCPCGRRSSHQVVEQGAPAPPLGCDAACDRQQRKARLADAFSIVDPEGYTAVHDRNRIPLYANSLLLAARKHPNFLAGLQRHLAAFMAESAAKRYALPSMPREERKLAHEVAEHYGLTTQSLGTEPQRHIELFKTPRSSVPGRLLSDAIDVLDAEQLGQMEREVRGFPVKLLDVTRGVDIPGFLSSWEGGFTLQRQPGGVCIVRFTTLAAAQEALQQLGGGVRGKFRVDPAAIAAYCKPKKPSTPAAAAPPASSSQPSAPVAQSRSAASQPASQPPAAQQPKLWPPPYQPPGASWTPVGRPIGRPIAAQGDPWDD